MEVLVRRLYVDRVLGRVRPTTESQTGVASWTNDLVLRPIVAFSLVNFPHVGDRSLSRSSSCRLGRPSNSWLIVTVRHFAKGRAKSTTDADTRNLKEVAQLDHLDTPGTTFYNPGNW